MSEIETQRFDTISDDGEEFTVIEWTRIIGFQSVAGPANTAKGTKRYTLADGRAVNRNDDETFEIVETDEILRQV